MAFRVPSGGASVSQLPWAEVSRAERRNAPRQTGSRQAFDIIEPLQFVGTRAYNKPWQDVFERFQTLAYEVRDLRITAGDDVAFSHSLNHIHGVMTNGQKTALWLRFTAGYRKVEGKWLIAHIQASVPSDLATGKAKLALRRLSPRPFRRSGIV